mmetsp:Transcript_8030/g.23018  ORF Transcript_8030/g.23018 Transcript_8030/m.23018 type:complete len:201 (+) Transcript_8030:2940-3542(+)
MLICRLVISVSARGSGAIRGFTLSASWKRSSTCIATSMSSTLSQKSVVSLKHTTSSSSTCSWQNLIWKTLLRKLLVLSSSSHPAATPPEPVCAVDVDTLGCDSFETTRQGQASADGGASKRNRMAYHPWLYRSMFRNSCSATKNSVLRRTLYFSGRTGGAGRVLSSRPEPGWQPSMPGTCSARPAPLPPSRISSEQVPLP